MQPNQPVSSRRPLIVRLCNMVGDVVLGIPALQLLEAQGYELHLYGKGWAGKLLEAHGWHVVPRASKLSERISQLRLLKQHCIKIDPGFGDRVNTLVMPNSFSSVFEPWWAGLRVAGYARDGRGFMLARKEVATAKPHALEGFWQLACSFLDLSVPPPSKIGLGVAEGSAAKAAALLAASGISEAFVCIVPYAAGVVDKQEKKWPGFPALTRRLLEEEYVVVTCPGPGEEQVAKQEHQGAVMLAGLDLGTYNGVLRQAALVVSNDTGPAHMAAALGTQVLSVLGPTKAEQWAPWGDNVRIVQAPGRQWPDVEAVLSAARDCLKP